MMTSQPLDNPVLTRPTFFERRIQPKEGWFGMTWSAIYAEAHEDYNAKHSTRYRVAMALRVLLALPVGIASLVPCILIQLFFRTARHFHCNRPASMC